MPAKDITIAANGQAFWRPPSKLKSLTLLNNSSTLSVNFRSNLYTDFVTLSASTKVDFEPEEAAEVQELVFTGSAGLVIEVIWA